MTKVLWSEIGRDAYAFGLELLGPLAEAIGDGPGLEERWHSRYWFSRAATIYATPYQVKNPERTASRLAAVLNLPHDGLLKELTAKNGFSYLAHKIDVPTAEKIKQMNLPGIGTTLISAVTRRDYPMVQGIILVFGMIVVVVSYLSDVVSGWVDPRTRTG